MNIRKYWENLSQNKKLFILKENLFWDGLIFFKYTWLPEELINIIKKYTNE